MQRKKIENKVRRQLVQYYWLSGEKNKVFE